MHVLNKLIQRFIYLSSKTRSTSQHKYTHWIGVCVSILYRHSFKRPNNNKIIGVTPIPDYNWNRIQSDIGGKKNIYKLHSRVSPKSSYWFIRLHRLAVVFCAIHSFYRRTRSTSRITNTHTHTTHERFNTTINEIFLAFVRSFVQFV